MISLPTYRAKHYRDDIYFIGSLIGKEDEYYIIQDEDMEYYRPIDPTTLAIHFPDMLDSQGNKIFASLSKDGKGGDICTTTNGVKHLLIYKDFKIIGINTDFFGNFKGTLHSNINLNFVKNAEYKVIGIQK